MGCPENISGNGKGYRSKMYNSTDFTKWEGMAVFTLTYQGKDTNFATKLFRIILTFLIFAHISKLSQPELSQLFNGPILITKDTNSDKFRHYKTIQNDVTKQLVILLIIIINCYTLGAFRTIFGLGGILLKHVQLYKFYQMGGSDYAFSVLNRNFWSSRKI